MRILLTNDDGYLSEGLMLLCNELARSGHELWVVAPDGQRSATSHAVNFHRNLIVKQLNDYCGAKKAFICSGTPADCVKFADSMLDVEFDLLVSGPNNGENYGCAMLYSGTVAAAEEGTLCGIKSIALSRLGYNRPFGGCVDYFVSHLEELAFFSKSNSLLNVNVPDLPLSQIKGARVAPQSKSRLFADYFVETDEPDIFRVVGDRVSDAEEGSDILFADEGYVTITPITVLRTDFAAMDELKRLEK